METTKTSIKEILRDLFTTKNDIVVFNDKYMDKDNAEKYAIYKVVSGIMHDSGLTHGFSYEIGNRAVNVLVDLEDWDNDDAISEAVDAIVPVYTHEIMQIYTDNSWAVDEAVE